LLELDGKARLEFTRMTGAVVQRMRECPLPIVAAVNGVAAGAGAVIALAADLRIVARSASFAFLFTKVGLAGADMGSAYLLPRLVGLGRATELLLLGETVDAETALRYGLATRVVDDDRLADEARALAEQIAMGPGLAYASTKALLTRELDLDLASAIELEAQTQAALLGSRDHREFHASFVEKREPRFEGR
jgi:enoyl-CoA hydratase/carnithine racemase